MHTIVIGLDSFHKSFLSDTLKYMLKTGSKSYRDLFRCSGMFLELRWSKSIFIISTLAKLGNFLLVVFLLEADEETGLLGSSTFYKIQEAESL